MRRSGVKEEGDEMDEMGYLYQLFWFTDNMWYIFDLFVVFYSISVNVNLGKN